MDILRPMSGDQVFDLLQEIRTESSPYNSDSSPIGMARMAALLAILEAEQKKAVYAFMETGAAQ